MKRITRLFVFVILLLVLATSCFPITPTPTTTPPPTETPVGTTRYQLVPVDLQDMVGPHYASANCPAAGGGLSDLCVLIQNMAVRAIVRLYTGDPIPGHGDGSIGDITLIAEPFRCNERSEYFNQFIGQDWRCAVLELKREYYENDPAGSADFTLEIGHDENVPIPQEGDVVTITLVTVPFVWDVVPDQATMQTLSLDYEPQWISAQTLGDVGLGNRADWENAHLIRLWIDVEDANGDHHYMPGRLYDGADIASRAGTNEPSYRVEPGYWPTFVEDFTIYTAGSPPIVDYSFGVEFFCDSVALCSNYLQHFDAVLTTERE